MKYLLDTNIIVDHLRGKKPIGINLIKAGCGASILSQAELIYGAYKSFQPQRNLAKIKAMFFDLEIQIITLNEEIIDQYAKLKAQLEKRGERLDEFDLLIAATAMVMRLVLVTGNISHFQRISYLKVIPQ